MVEGRSLTRRSSQELPPELDADKVVEALAGAVQALDARPSAAGLAIPGEMDGAGRCWGMADFRGFDGVHLGDELAARLECPVSLESEGNAAAIAERRYGHGRAHPNLLTLLIHERLSAGLVLGGELHRGNAGFAAQLAHLRIHSGDRARACDCGRRGCLDAHVKVTDELLEKAAGGDEQAAAEVRDLIEALGSGIAIAQNVLDLDAIVLTSSSARLFRQIEPGLRHTLRELVYGSAAAEVPLFEGSLGLDAVLVGAAALARDATEAAAAAQGA